MWNSDSYFSFSSAEYAVFALAAFILLVTWIFSLWRWISDSRNARKRAELKQRLDDEAADQLRVAEQRKEETFELPDDAGLPPAVRKLREEERRRSAMMRDEDVDHGAFTHQQDDDSVRYLLPPSVVSGAALVDPTTIAATKAVDSIHPILDVHPSNAHEQVLRRVHRSNGTGLDRQQQQAARREALKVLAETSTMAPRNKGAGGVDVMFVSRQVEAIPVHELPWLTPDEVDVIERTELTERKQVLLQSGRTVEQIQRGAAYQPSSDTTSVRNGTSERRSVSTSPRRVDSRQTLPVRSSPDADNVSAGSYRMPPSTRSPDAMSSVGSASSKLQRVLSDRSLMTARRAMEAAVSDVMSQTSASRETFGVDEWVGIARRSNGMFQYQSSTGARMRNVLNRMHGGTGVDGFTIDIGIPREQRIDDLDEETFRDIEFEDKYLDKDL